MNQNITEVHVRRHGKLVHLQAFGRTNRGTKYLVGQRVVPKEKTSNKSDLSKIEELLEEIITERNEK